MPEGQLDVLPQKEVRDLIAYLMSPVQVPIPTGTPNGDARPRNETSQHDFSHSPKCPGHKP